MEKSESNEDGPKVKSKRLNDPSESLPPAQPTLVNTIDDKIDLLKNSTTPTRTTSTTTTPAIFTITTSVPATELASLLSTSTSPSSTIDGDFNSSNFLQITSKSFSTSYTGSRAPFTCWGINFEGFPDIPYDSTDKNNNNNVNNSNNNNNNNIKSHSDNLNVPDKFNYCGICASIVKDSDSLKCLTCPLILHQSCLQYTNLKVQLIDIDPNEWSCPICSLCLYCNTQSKSRLKSQNLTRDYFRCIFCPAKNPLIFMERLRSGLFAHSICRLIVNIEEPTSSNCSLCGDAGVLVSHHSLLPLFLY